MGVTEVRVKQIFDTSVLKGFACGISQMDEFLQKKLSSYIKALECKAFVIYSGDNPIAMFALGFDSLELDYQESNDVIYRDEIDIPQDHEDDFMYMNSHPALEISFLAVSKNYQRQNIGRAIVGEIRKLAMSQQIGGCQFLTVIPLVSKDYSSLGFYERIGFKQVKPIEYFKDRTIRMYLPLQIWSQRA